MQNKEKKTISCFCCSPTDLKTRQKFTDNFGEFKVPICALANSHICDASKRTRDASKVYIRTCAHPHTYKSYFFVCISRWIDRNGFIYICKCSVPNVCVENRFLKFKECLQCRIQSRNAIMQKCLMKRGNNGWVARIIWWWSVNNVLVSHPIGHF